MRITTLNLHEFNNWEARQPAIVEYLQSVSSDIVLFQEVVYLPDVSPYNQAQLLNQTLKYSNLQSAVTRLQPSTKYQTYREGLAALSKHPVVQSDTIVLKQTQGDEHNRIVQLLDININGRIVKIANIHFSLSDTVDYSTPHLKETLEILATRGEERIIAGDFNLSNLEEMTDLWQEKYHCSTEKDYVSFPGMNKRIDYFLIPKVYSFESISTSKAEISDHRALTVDVDYDLLGATSSETALNLLATPSI
jgi:endonuclease/exonuclease/phosphatase family metal-dependent hydrolase